MARKKRVHLLQTPLHDRTECGRKVERHLERDVFINGSQKIHATRIRTTVTCRACLGEVHG